MAREILHRDYVTDEDIGRLERAGHFEHLVGDARSPESALPSSAPPAK
jgi:hypothetical protein